tara:strand:+ start:685 stop:888 length:204 start_codon:yes stop_codon:yes gene_type:complete
MKSINTIQHDLRRDIQNVLNVLKFIKSDVEIKDHELKAMVDVGVNLEDSILTNMDKITKTLKEKSDE